MDVGGRATQEQLPSICDVAIFESLIDIEIAALRSQ